MDVESLAKELILKGMTPEQQTAILESIKATMTQARALQKQRVGENVQVVVQALKKLEADIRDRYDEVGNKIEKRVATIKDGQDGRNGTNGRDGKDGRPGRDGGQGQKGTDGLPGRDGRDGENGVSVTDAHIDFDGSLIISLSSGRTINVGEVVAPDLAEKIKVITNGGGTSQVVLDTLASLQTQINNLIPSQTGNAGKVLTTNGTALSWASVAGGLSYQGTWNASSNTPTLASGVGVNGYYYITATAGSTNLDGITDWQIGDWLMFNGTVWQKIDQSNLVTSVAGRTGAVVLANTDISGLGTMSTQNASSVAIIGGAIDGATIGATTASSAKLTTGLVGANASFTDFPNAQFIGSQANTGSAHIYNIGVAGEGVATDVAGAGQWGVGVYGTGSTAGATRGIGVVGDGHCGNTADTAAAIGVRGYATQTHSGGQNIGLYAQATGGASNYALFMASGNIYSAVSQTWAIPDNTANALSIDASGKAGILAVTTTDGAESVTMSGKLSVTGVATLGNGAVLGTPASGNFSSGTFTWPTFNQNTTGTAANVTGTVAVANGGTGQTTANTAFNALAPSQTSNSGKYLTTDGTNSSWAAIVSGAGLSNDTTTASNLFPLFASATTGTPTTIFTSNAQYLFKPSTGELSVKAPRASNGIVVNSATISSDYTIATGDNGGSFGPVSVNSGVTVTVSSGSVWTVV